MKALPRLKDNYSGPVLQCHKGDCTNIHERCPLNEVCIKGCEFGHDSCSQRKCTRQCNDCGGGVRFQNSGLNLCPAICGKAPLREAYLADVMKDHYEFKKQPVLKFKNKAIIMLRAGFHGVQNALIEGLGAVCVPLSRVWSPRGWLSQDMKDLLCVPADVKLVLLSCTTDEVIERAYEQEAHLDDIHSLGFDAWELYNFSWYEWYGRAQNIWNGYRAVRVGELSGSQFSQMPPPELRSDDPSILRPWKTWSMHAPQLTANWQFVRLKYPEVWKSAMASVLHSLKLMPGVKAVWFQGVSTGAQAYNIRLNMPPEVDCYFTSTLPWLYAFKGLELDPKTGSKIEGKSKKTRQELLLQNQHAYVNLVNRAVAEAIREIDG